MLIVFDLDFTLWDCGGTWCDCTRPPYSKKGPVIVDSFGRNIKLYSDVLEILVKLQKMSIPIAIASRTEEPNWAEKLIILFNINQFFQYKEIFPSSKLQHFNNLKKTSGFDFENMYFFDDEQRNIDEVSRLGVNSLLVTNGLDKQQFTLLTGIKI